MAAVVSLQLNQVGPYLMADTIGAGALVPGDTLITDLQKYPLGSRYLDMTARVEYRRIGEAKVIGDWIKTVAYTVAT